MNAKPVATATPREIEAPVGTAKETALQLAASMPRLVLEARRVAASVFHGLHEIGRAHV